MRPKEGHITPALQAELARLATLLDEGHSEACAARFRMLAPLLARVSQPGWSSLLAAVLTSLTANEYGPAMPLLCLVMRLVVDAGVWHGSAWVGPRPLAFVYFEDPGVGLAWVPRDDGVHLDYLRFRMVPLGGRGGTDASDAPN